MRAAAVDRREHTPDLPGVRVDAERGGVITWQAFWMPATGARFRVLETDTGGTRGVAAGKRTGGRILVIQETHRYFARQIEDNGQDGTLLDTLDPYGPRYTLRPVVS